MFFKKAQTEKDILSPSEMNKKYSGNKVGKWILTGVICIFSLVFYCSLSYYLSPPGMSIRVGHYYISNTDYETIINKTLENAGISEEIIEKTKISAPIYQNYVAETMQLGIKAKELGYTLQPTDNPQEFGKYGEYIILGERLRQHTTSSVDEATFSEVKQYYNENKELFKTNPTVTFRVFEGTEEQYEEFGDSLAVYKTMDAVEFAEKYEIYKINEGAEEISTNGVFNAYISDITINDNNYQPLNEVNQEIKAYLEYKKGQDAVNSYIEEVDKEYRITLF